MKLAIMWRQQKLCYGVHKLLATSIDSAATWAREYATNSTHTSAALGRSLERQVAVITGAASGIGEATARSFIAHGARVIIADIQDEAGTKLAKDLGPNAHFIHCDVSKEEDVSESVGLAVSVYGQLDIMYNNAGIVMPKSMATGTGISDLNLADMHEMFRTNVYGVALGIKHAARVMKPQRRGCIICTASTASIQGGLASHHYTVSKHAVVGLTRSSASELSEYGIRVNCISPTGVMTPLLRLILSNPKIKKKVDDLRTSAAGCNLSKTFLSPDEVAKAALFLASNGNYISGHNLVIDGSRSVTGSPKLFPLETDDGEAL
ncbi:hypothetical protein O6H91_21G023100 [Diphasiastrum complanatum]|uniref:Uncharacterized protein n=1 Tax=Diphasiastrum complanatum TaxID=34168 RepID=A0ACC2AIM0_DIPCM|nr:hypothetical protein O6H91_Y366200 [Diphasiastrum complanatum]KAJ7517410.1 hypothetical protein O6H91_21G023100 [Diphasiastrum complanatum]